jgi:hypothetical protein
MDSSSHVIDSSSKYNSKDKILKQKRKRQKNSKIDNKTRQLLVNLIKSKKFKLKDIALFLNMNYSTAKTIARVYREENRITRKYKLKQSDFSEEKNNIDSDIHTKIRNQTNLKQENNINFMQKNLTQSKKFTEFVELFCHFFEIFMNVDHVNKLIIDNLETLNSLLQVSSILQGIFKK